MAFSRVLSEIVRSSAGSAPGGLNRSPMVVVRIATKGKEGLSAVHEFLKFQISEHRTRDILDVTKETVK